MTTPLRMDEDQSHMTERIFNLTLEIIYLLTGESFLPVKCGNYVTVMVPPHHSLISDGHNKQRILEITRKMMELLTGEEWQHIEGNKDLYKDTMMENQLPLTSPDGSSKINPPERCTGPLYYQDCSQADHTTPHHYQGGELRHVGVVVVEEVEEEMFMQSDQQSMEDSIKMRAIKEEEEETYVRSDQQSMEVGVKMRTIKEEKEAYVRSDQQSMEEGDMMRTSKEEEEETYARSDQQSMEEGDMMRTSKEKEEETYVRSDQQSKKEGIMMRTIKEEEEETYVRSDQQSMEEAWVWKLLACPNSLSTGTKLNLRTCALFSGLGTFYAMNYEENVKEIWILGIPGSHKKPRYLLRKVFYSCNLSSVHFKEVIETSVTEPIRAEMNPLREAIIDLTERKEADTQAMGRNTQIQVLTIKIGD
ncbi:uncharacterized protein [Hyperolius riggenbachi]|uniref:uncharacterized protein n=1 Tax=Hyperolius riggenbachi TaxID=752182 RepID=UPI0035A3B38A